MSWEDSFVGNTNYVEREINGKKIKFFPVSVSVMFKLRRVAKPLAKAVGVLFSQQGRSDTGVTSRTFEQGSETVMDAITVELAEFRAKQITESVAEVLDVLTDPQNAEVIGDLIINSCRGIFAPGDKTNPPGAEVFNKMDGETLKGYLMGVFEANKGVIGPLAETVRAKVADGIPAVETEQTAG